MYVGKEAYTQDNLDLGRVDDVGITDDGEVYYLVEKGRLPKARHAFTQQDLIESNDKIIVKDVMEVTETLIGRSHFLCMLYGLEVRTMKGERIGTIDNFVAGPRGGIVVIEDLKRQALLARHQDFNWSKISKFIVLRELPPQDDLLKYFENLGMRDQLLTKDIKCDLSRTSRGLLYRIRKWLEQTEEDRIIADMAEKD